MTIAVIEPPLIDLIENAADYLCARGYIDPEDEFIPDSVVADLTRLWLAGSCGRYCPWRSIQARASVIADHWVAEKQEEYERSVPTWTCDCGATYKVLPDFSAEAFWTLSHDGLLGEHVGGVKRDRKGHVKGSAKCPACGVAFAETIDRQTNPQQRLF
jgi:hypothetical protein